MSSLVCRNPCRDIPRLLRPPPSSCCCSKQQQQHEPIQKLIVDRQEVEEKEARILSMALSSRGSALKVLYLYKNQISTQSLCTILLGLSSSLSAPRQLPSCLMLPTNAPNNNNPTAGSLESLYLCVTPLSFPVVQLLSSVLRVNNVLKELYLWENGLEEKSIVHLSVHGLASNNTLTKLVITRNANMTGRAAAAVVDAFGTCNHCDAENEPVSYPNDQLPRMQQHNQHQRVLNLSHNKMDCHQIQELMEPLSRATLAKLCLDGNPFGNHGARALAEALSHNPRIQRLDVARTRMGCTGIMELVRRGLSTRTNNHLLHLVLSHNNLNNNSGRRCLQTVLDVLQNSNHTVRYIELPRASPLSSLNGDASIRSQIDFYLALNRAGRLPICADQNLDWRLFPWILAGKELSVMYYFLSIKPELCQGLGKEF